MLLSISYQIIATKFFDSVIISRFGKTKVAKEEFYGAKKPIKNWDVNVDESAKCPTCSRALRASCPHALVLYVLRALRVLVLYVPRALRTPMPQVLGALRALVSHVPRALRALVPHVLCTLLAFVLCVPHVLRALLPYVSRFLRALALVAPVPHAQCVLVPPCLVHHVPSCFKSPLRALVSCLTLRANISFCNLKFPCLTLLFFRSFPTCDYFGGIYSS